MLIRSLGTLECTKVLTANRLGRLACTQEGRPYVVPIHFAYGDNHLYAFSMPGKKIEWMRANPLVSVLIEERGQVANAREVGAHMQQRLRELASHELVGEVRGIGLIAAVELVGDKATKEPWGQVGALGGLANSLLLKNGVISRNMGDTLAFCPPLIITKPQIDQMVDAVKRALDAALEQVKMA